MGEATLESLKESELFAGLNDSQFEILYDLTEIQEFQPGEIILAEGSPGDSFHVLLKGVVGIEKATPEGYPRPMALLENEGDFFGEMAVVDIEPRSATVRAHVKTYTAVFSKDSLMKLFDSYPEVMTGIVLNIARALSRRLRSSGEDLAAISG